MDIAYSGYCHVLTGLDGSFGQVIRNSTDKHEATVPILEDLGVMHEWPVVLRAVLARR